MNEISVTEVKGLLDSGADFQLIDVREPFERGITSIGGENIPLGDIINAASLISRHKQVVVYCRSGGRSSSAIQALEQQFGFTNLYNMRGGILAYAEEIDPTLTKY